MAGYEASTELAKGLAIRERLRSGLMAAEQRPN